MRQAIESLERKVAGDRDDLFPALFASSARKEDPVTKLNENICAQIERAAELLRAAAANRTTTKQVGRGGVPNRPELQEFVDTAASLEALVKRVRRNAPK